ncbi:hypothetical protein Trydic_g20956 [Trypoxylus dichotomus]
MSLVVYLRKARYDNQVSVVTEIAYMELAHHETVMHLTDTPSYLMLEINSLESIVDVRDDISRETWRIIVSSLEVVAFLKPIFEYLQMGRTLLATRRIECTLVIKEGDFRVEKHLKNDLGHPKDKSTLKQEV